MTDTEQKVQAAQEFAVGKLEGLASGKLPITPELTQIAFDLLEVGLKHLVAALFEPPRVDVVVGKDAKVHATID